MVFRDWTRRAKCILLARSDTETSSLRSDIMAPFRGSKKTKATYVKQAQFLRRAGFNIAFKGNKKSSPQQRAAVTRLFQPISAYTKTHGFKFHAVPRRNRRVIKGAFSSQQITPGGVFIQRPTGVEEKDFKVSIRKSGVTLAGRNYRDVIIAMDPRKLAVDPEQAAKDAIGKRNPVFVKMVVNGFEARGDANNPKEKLHALKLFWSYWENLYSDLTSEDPEDRERGGRAMTDDEIADTFHLKLIY